MSDSSERKRNTSAEPREPWDWVDDDDEPSTAERDGFLLGAVDDGVFEEDCESDPDPEDNSAEYGGRTGSDVLRDLGLETKPAQVQLDFSQAKGWNVVESDDKPTADDFGPSSFWPAVPVKSTMAPDRARAWETVMSSSMARDSDGKALPFLSDDIPPRPCLPRAFDGYTVVYFSTMRVLDTNFGGGFGGSLKRLDELRKIPNLILVIPAGSLLAMEPSSESSNILTDFLSHAEEITHHIILTGAPSDMQRLRRRGIALEVVHVNLPPVPTSLHEIPPEVCLCRDEEVEAVAALLVPPGSTSTLGCRHVLVTGKAGVGKSVMCSAVAEVLRRRGVIVLALYAHEILAGTEFRGQFEARISEIIAWAEAQAVPVVLFIDEIMRLNQRTGRQDGLNTDSWFDYTKTVMAMPRPPFLILGTATTEERNRLKELEQAVHRRFVTFPLTDLEGDSLVAVIMNTAKESGVSEREAARVMRLAPHILPSEASPAREIKLLALVSKHRSRSALVAIRSQFGELPAPRVRVLLKGVARLDKVIFGRRDMLDSVRDCVEAAIENVLLLGNDEARPFMVTIVMGRHGAGKRFFTSALAKALGVNRVHTCAMDRSSLASFVHAHRDEPGGALILEGSGSSSAAPRQDAQAPAAAASSEGNIGGILEALSSGLNRWLIVIVCHTDDTLPAEPLVHLGSPCPVVLLPFAPVTLGRDEGKVLARALRRSIRAKVRDQGIGLIHHIDTDALAALLEGGCSPHDLERFLIRQVMGRSLDLPLSGAGPAGTLLSYNVGTLAGGGIN